MSDIKKKALIQAALPTFLLLSGCGAGGLTVSITGNLDVSGDVPAGYSLELYAQSDNAGAFDTSFCLDQIEGGGDLDCFGRVDTTSLSSPLGGTTVTVDGSSFTIDDVALDVYYVLVATGDDGSIACTTDVIGFDEDTKVVTSESAITVGADQDLSTWELPRSVRLSCAAPATEPAAPADPEPEPQPDDESINDDGDIDVPDTADPSTVWSSFTITSKDSGAPYADASAGNDDSDLACDSSFPPAMLLSATPVDSSITEAYLRFQFGTGDDATYRTIPTPVYDGTIEQAISLTGGHAVIQLDTDSELDGVGESYTATFCQGKAPAQELLVILSWDKDDTDVDAHVTSNGTEVAYYSMQQSWGELDIDDVDGYGPETISSAPDASGNIYEVKLHYYSDHGNGDTTATARVIYYDSSTGQTCDVTATQTMSSYDWWDVGVFGPGLACP